MDAPSPGGDTFKEHEERIYRQLKTGFTQEGELFIGYVRLNSLSSPELDQFGGQFYSEHNPNTL